MPSTHFALLQDAYLNTVLFPLNITKYDHCTPYPFINWWLRLYSQEIWIANLWCSYNKPYFSDTIPFTISYTTTFCLGFNLVQLHLYFSGLFWPSNPTLYSAAFLFVLLFLLPFHINLPLDKFLYYINNPVVTLHILCDAMMPNKVSIKVFYASQLLEISWIWGEVKL